MTRTAADERAAVVLHLKAMAKRFWKVAHEAESEGLEVSMVSRQAAAIACTRAADAIEAGEHAKGVE